ncbi:hypothetical protein LJR219_001698 [Phenylobacterium sp. LjRoot219]|uniref:hypothetical protein n=1 Tax=Phenylobacterium sp. LjRoot219 TaxID=3342283 RepID=UPI003ECD9F58
MQLDPAFDMDGPVELDDLDRAVLWAMRSVAVGRVDCPSLRRTFLDLYGPPADQILCALMVMIRLMASRTSGGLRMHMPGSSAVSRDELLILAALSAVQAQAAENADASLAELLGLRRDPGLLAAVRYVADLLADRGRRLSGPERELWRPEPAKLNPRVHTVH